jgi:hypothetical protein
VLLNLTPSKVRWITKGGSRLYSCHKPCSWKACAESVLNICLRLNKAYNLDGKRQLTRSTVYQATKDGLAGVSPKKKGPPSNIPAKLLEVLVKTHAEKCQVGDGELKCLDVKRFHCWNTIGNSRLNLFGGRFAVSIQRPSKQPTRYLLKTLAHNGRHTTI